MNRLLLRTILLSTVFLLSVRIGTACGCYPYSAVLDNYEQADLVVVVRFLSVTKTTQPKWPGTDIATATMIVERVYKGDVKSGDKLLFAQGDAVLDCSWTFYEQDIGAEYLLYLYRPERPSELFKISTCNRSRGLENAGDDLLYLNKIDKVRGRTRVSGVLEEEGSDDSTLAGRKIRIIGKNKTYIATTDKDGLYEIYDLPPGRYVLAPELKFGWRVDEFHPTLSPRWSESKPRNSLAFRLRARRHFGVDIRLKLSNHVSGTVRDSKSKPMQWVNVSLAAVGEEGYPHWSDLTDARGRFQIDSVPAGTYVLILNYENERTARMPFPTLYYNNATEREKATTITINHGESVNNLNVVIQIVMPTADRL